MLYYAYQAQQDAFAPIKFFAQTFHGVLDRPWPWLADMPFMRETAAAMELLSHAGLSHDHPPFGIHEVIVDGKPAPVSEEVVAVEPFCRLLHFRKEATRCGPKLLVVAPLSGHFSTLLRGTVATLLPDHDVYLTDWINARNVPLLHGPFELDDFVDLIIRFLRRLGPGCHVMAVCQPAVPTLAAVSLLAEEGDACQPPSMVLMGGPIDPSANPTEVNRFAKSHSLDWFERTVIHPVPARYAGAFRRVYPGFLQLAGFLSMNLGRHISAHWTMFRNLVRGDGESAAATRAFYDEYTSVMDLPAEFYLQTIKRVFHDEDLAHGRFRVHGRVIDPAAIERTALMTVEGERDDICGAGQTVAAQGLCRNLPSAKKRHHLQPKVGHYGVFNGRRWETETYPKVADFIRQNS
ncbi:MAG TPA: polyhydroxyalkanoate depolymerase [Stellaceae bacterium]|nr:polyhydroxyalkanoate depolymerase [Stellaceae bacterium]